VVASLFHLPFAEASFDLVYSQGVLHHTYSTYEAFRNGTRYVRPGGQICIWVNGLEDHLAGHGLSGWVHSLLPHLFFKRLKRHGPRWTLANTEHSVRDRLKPRYARKHSFNEVIVWYEEQGLTTQVHSPTAYRRLFGRPLWGMGLKGTKR
jgi:SAM-dependent methyltransferase